jgi:hypothetical protein
MGPSIGSPFLVINSPCFEIDLPGGLFKWLKKQRLLVHIRLAIVRLKKAVSIVASTARRLKNQR